MLSVLDKIRKIFTYKHSFYKNVHNLSDLKLVKNIKGRRVPSFNQLWHFKYILSPVERIFFNLAILFLIIGLFWSGLVIANKYRYPIPTVAGTYNEGIIGSIQTINPLYASLNDADQDLVKLIYSGLMRFDKNQRLVPDLAVKYTKSDDSKEYIFELRHDVLWHDLKKFTADDVVFTFELLQDPIVNSPLNYSFQNVKVEKIDDYTIKFILDEPYQSFLSSLTVGILPKHIWLGIPNDQIRLAGRNLQPIGTGPFKFKKLIKDNSGYIIKCELERFADYYRQPPFIENFVFYYFTDYETDNGAIKSLREQKIDGLSFVPVHLKDKVERKHVNLKVLQLPQYTALFLNQKNLSDKDLRKALRLAIDKNKILLESIDGQGKVISGPVLENFPGYSPDKFRVKYSVEEANKILDSKWTRISAKQYEEQLRENLIKQIIEEKKTALKNSSSTNNNVSSTKINLTVEDNDRVEQELQNIIDQSQLFYRQDKNKNLLTIHLVTADTEEYKMAAKLVAGYWKEIGVNVETEFVNPNDLLRTNIKNRDYDVLLYSVILGGDYDQSAFWSSEQINYPGLNLSVYSNKEVDSVLKTIRRTDMNDMEKLSSLYKKLQENIFNDIPAIFLYTPTYIYALNDKIKGFGVTSIGHPSDRFADIINWYIKTKKIWRFSK